MKSNLVFRFGGESLLTSDKMSRELQRNGIFFLQRLARATGIVLATQGAGMVLYPRMKRLFPISCIGSIILLSSCTLTQQQAPLSAEDAAAQSRAASELDAALIQEEIRLIKEAREEEKRRAREEAEQKAREEAEEKAREEAEARAEAEERAREEAEARAAEEERAREEAEARAAEEERARTAAEEQQEAGNDRTPQLLSSRRKQKAEEEIITPTAEQQEAARKMLTEQAVKNQDKKKAAPVTEHEQEEEEVQLPGSELRGGLRTRRFAPPEEAISRDDNDEPLPNSVELRGLRSPVMKGNLPMNIDGKIIKED